MFKSKIINFIFITVLVSGQINAAAEKKRRLCARKTIYLITGTITTALIVYLCKKAFKPVKYPYNVFGQYKKISESLAIELSENKNKTIRFDQLSPELQSYLINVVRERRQRDVFDKVMRHHYSVKFTNERMEFIYDELKGLPHLYEYPLKDKS